MAESQATPGSEVRIHPCGPADRGRQADLFNRCFRKPLDAAALAWRYDGNPAGPAISLLTLSASGEAVSGYACSPRIALSGGDEASRGPIGETGDVMTHPDWRKKGLFSALDRAALSGAEERGWPVVFGLPNRRSAHIFLDLGWRRVGTLRPWTFVLKDDRGARRARSREGRLQGWLVPLALRRARKAREVLAARSGGRFKARAIDSFPEEVAALSRAVEPRFALMARRDRAFLEWRFTRSPSGLHRSIGVFDEQGALAAYAVVQLPRPGETDGFLVDALARDDDALAAAIDAGLERLSLAGASVAQSTAIDGSWWSERLQEAGFLPPRASHHMIVIARVIRPEHPLAKAALDAKGWYLTDGDRDDETMG